MHVTWRYHIPEVECMTIAAFLGEGASRIMQFTGAQFEGDLMHAAAGCNEVVQVPCLQCDVKPQARAKSSGIMFDFRVEIWDMG